MKIKARIIEVGSDGHHPYVRIHVKNIDDVRVLGALLYEDVEVETKPRLTAPDATCTTCGKTFCCDHNPA